MIKHFWADAVDVKSLGLLYEEMTSCGEDRLICGAGWTPKESCWATLSLLWSRPNSPGGTSGCVELRFFQCYNLAKVITVSLNKHWGSTRSLDESLTDHADDLPVSKSRRSGVMGRTFPGAAAHWSFEIQMWNKSTIEHVNNPCRHLGAYSFIVDFVL
jgi:hypothetical protein